MWRLLGGVSIGGGGMFWGWWSSSLRGWWSGLVPATRRVRVQRPDRLLRAWSFREVPVCYGGFPIFPRGCSHRRLPHPPPLSPDAGYGAGADRLASHRSGVCGVVRSSVSDRRAGLGQYLFYPNTFTFNFDLATFALFVPLALVFTAIQTTTEELFFRGYVVQGASMISTNRVFLALVAAVVFTLPHLLNPEVSAGGWLTVFSNYFLVPGLLWTVVSLIDGTTELAIGVHFANNIIGILVINRDGSALPTPALFKISEFHATYVALSVLVVIPIFLAITYKVFKLDEASEPVS